MSKKKKNKKKQQKKDEKKSEKGRMKALIARGFKTNKERHLKGEPPLLWMACANGHGIKAVLNEQGPIPVRKG